MDIQAKIAELMAVESFRNAFENVTTPIEVVELFRKNGIEVPMDIAEELFQPVPEAEGELDVTALDEVAGGGIGGAIGSAIGSGIFYGAGYLGGRLAGWDKKKSASYAKTCSSIGSTLGNVLGTAIAG